MTRIAFPAATVLAVCLAMAACSKPRTEARAFATVLCPRCNVVLVSMDTVRADHLGLYGYKRKTSPNVDALATRATVFENAISQAAWTLPAHGAMMTGLYPARLGVTRYPAQRSLPKGATMLAEVFRRAGYATAGFTGGGFVSAHFGFNRGFDVYVTAGRRFEHNMDQALGWLDENKNRPFFIFLHGYNAHRPYYSEAVDKRAIGLRPVAGREEQRGFCSRKQRERSRNLATVIRYYDASIHHADREVGRFLAALHEAGADRNTVILVTADHGEEFFEHGNCDHVRFLYHEVVRVPYILLVPGLEAQGKRIDEPVPASISVARTLLDIVGIASDMPGVSLAPILEGGKLSLGAVYSEADTTLGALGSRGRTIAMTTDRFKLIAYPEEGTDEAYDITVDPEERHVLPESSSAYRSRKTLRAWRSALVALPKAKTAGREVAKGRGAAGKLQGSSRPPAENKDEGMELPKKLRDSLRSLGYLDD